MFRYNVGMAIERAANVRRRTVREAIQKARVRKGYPAGGSSRERARRLRQFANTNQTPGIRKIVLE